MKNCSRILALSLIAGLAGVAFAGPENEDVPMTGAIRGDVKRVTPVGVQGSGGSTRSVSLQNVFDTADLDGLGTPAYTGFTQGLIADWGTMSLPRTGPSAFGPRTSTIDEVYFGLSNTLPDLFNDVVITFWDNPRMWETTGVANSGGFQASSTTISGAFIVSLADATPLFPSFSVYQVQGLSQLAAPIALDDNFFGITVEVLQQGTSTRDTGAVQIFNTDVNGAIVGWSEDRFGRDVTINNIIDETECNRVFTGVGNPANLFLRVDTLFCDSDFDGSGFSDTDDFDAMVRAYEAGC